MLEYDKFQELQAKSQLMQEDYDQQLAEMEEKRESALQEMTVYYENKLQDLSSKLEQVFIHSVQKKTPNHVFFYTSVENL